MTTAELLDAGWTVSKTSLYDEECVEGWIWTEPESGKEFTVIGDWSEPPSLPNLETKPIGPSDKVKRFADFLDDLMNNPGGTQ